MSTVFFMIAVLRGRAENTLHGLVHRFDNNSMRRRVDEMQTLRTKASHKKMTIEEAESVGVRALSYIADDEKRLALFLDATGLRPETIRRATAAPGFLAAVLDHVAADEVLLLGLANALSTAPERIMEARSALSPPEAE
jgi:hypothetical protein